MTPLESLRSEVDRVDVALLALLARRIEVVQRIAMLKRATARTERDLAREEEVRARACMKAARFGLSTTAARTLIDAALAASWDEVYAKGRVMEETIELKNVAKGGELIHVSLRDAVLALAEAGVRTGAWARPEGGLVSLTITVTDAPPKGVASYTSEPADPRLFGKGPSDEKT